MNGNLDIIIFDVDHGFCSLISTPNNLTILIDCGRKKYFSPILFAKQFNWFNRTLREYGHPLTLFISSHPHSDHIEDIKLLSDIKPQLIWTITLPDVFLDTSGLKHNKEVISEYKGFKKKYVFNMPMPDFGCDLMLPPSLTFLETENVNNMSQCIGISFAGHKIFFPGDLEEDGLALQLKKQAFFSALVGTTIYIAPHHGHTSGFNSQIFRIIYPYIVVVSAAYGDEHVDSRYSRVSRGIVDFSTSIPKIRYQYSTRKDGTLFISIKASGIGWISSSKLPDNDFESMLLDALKYFQK